MKTTAERKAERKAEKFARQFHSEERCRFMSLEPCEVRGKRGGVQNAHMKSRGSGGTYRDIVPLHWLVHHHLDTASDEGFERRYKRTKQSVRDRAPHYHQRWKDRR